MQSVKKHRVFVGRLGAGQEDKIIVGVRERGRMPRLLIKRMVCVARLPNMS